MVLCMRACVCGAMEYHDQSYIHALMSDLKGGEECGECKIAVTLEHHAVAKSSVEPIR